jgi:hypothetical protein
VCQKVSNVQRALSFIGGKVNITDQSARPRGIKDKAIANLIGRGIILSNVAETTPHGPASGSPPIVDSNWHIGDGALSPPSRAGRATMCMARFCLDLESYKIVTKCDSVKAGCRKK